MNIYTGELQRFDEYDEMRRALEDLYKVPKSLEKEANKELGNKACTVVDLSKDTPLTRWAIAKQRSKNPAQKKSQKKARRANR